MSNQQPPHSPADDSNHESADKPVFTPYAAPAGGWGALHATAKALREQSVELKGSRALLSMNQPEGFDCPGCAWPDPRHTSSFEFCENGAKAVTWELTKRRVTREFFAAHTVRQLEQESDYWLEEQGRLTEPMRYDSATDHYLPVSWDEAFALIGRELNSLADPNEAEFYTSGRTSNEAAFMYQLFARRFGTNNFPDCSNMCHEPTSVGLPESIGIGKGTVLLDDFAHAEAIFILGQNPGTNSPRMLTELHNASRRRVPIVVFNPLRERALERFAAPQDPIEMATFGETRIASEYCQVRIGGDVAALKGVMKLVLEAHDEASRHGAEPVLDLDFIAQHTHGFKAFANDLRQTNWEDILRVCGLPRDQLERVAAVYMRARAVIVVYGMGITQHRLGTANVQQTVNLLLLRGNFGKPAAGICPVRGHSNVQGDRTMGIDEKPKPALLDQLKKAFGFEPPRAHGHNVVDASDGGWARQGVHRTWRQFRQSRTGLDCGRGRDAPLAADRRRQHQAQPRPSGSWRRGADPPRSGAERHRYAGGRSAVGHRRRQHVDGACVIRSRYTAERASEVGGRHRLRHGESHLERLRHRLGFLCRRLQPDPRQD